MKKQLIGMGAICMLLGGAGQAQATLITIGTATYDDGSGSADYNLIWDDDNNGNSVVWLDYTNAGTTWAAQNSWAAGLNTALTYNIEPEWTVDWGSNDWRLPSTVDGPYESGYDGTTTGGYNITNSEMGHLFYTELGNPGFKGTDGVVPFEYGLKNTGDFVNLVDYWYWSGTDFAASSSSDWVFGMQYGEQTTWGNSSPNLGLALRSGQVNAVQPVPEPATMLLFSAGLVGLAAFRTRRKQK